jgi:hypothetical protein
LGKLLESETAVSGVPTVLMLSPLLFLVSLVMLMPIMFLSSSAVVDVVGFPGPSCCHGLCCVVGLSPTRGLNCMMSPLLLIRFRLKYRACALFWGGSTLGIASLLLLLFLLLLTCRVSGVADVPSAVEASSDNFFSKVSGVPAVVRILTVR